jgi:hypothetical protein
MTVARVSLQLPQRQSTFFERLQNKPFWIWNIAKHKQEDIKTNGDCCFNHTISGAVFFGLWKEEFV